MSFGLRGEVGAFEGILEVGDWYGGKSLHV